MSGRRNGFWLPRRKALGSTAAQEIMSETKSELETALPFLEPVVYDFSDQRTGTRADLISTQPLMPMAIMLPLSRRYSGSSARYSVCAV